MKLLRSLSLIIALCGLSLNLQASEYELDMRDVKIRDFIDTVAKLTQKTIIVDQRVTGNVDVRTHKKVTAEELYEIFLVQLGVNGFAVVDLGNNILKVIPSQGAKLEGIEVEATGDADRSEKIITRVVQVDNVDVDKLVPVLRPLVDNQTGVVAPYAQSNVLLITDRESNVRKLLSIIQQVDKADTESTDVVQLQNASAKEMERILSSVINEMAKDGNAAGSRPSVVADVRTNSLLVRGDNTARAYLRRVIARLDDEIETSNNTKVIYLKYAKAKELVEVLTSVSESLLDGQKTEGLPAPTLQNNINILAHEQTNAVILSGSPVMIQTIEAIVQKLDIRRAQVLVEAIIVDMSQSKAKELGVQWLFSGDSSNGTVPAGGVNFTNTNKGIINIGAEVIDGGADDVASAIGGTNGAIFGIANISKSFSFTALINALATDSDSNVLSTPSLLTMDNEEAYILVGQEIPVITGSTAGDNNDNPFQTFTRQDVGIKLKVTPQINEGDSVQLAIEQEVSSVSGLSGADIITNKRQIGTSVLVEDGAVVVLGGLMDDDIQESASKVPLLGDLPGVGRAFRSDKTQRRKRNLMVFIRPTILRDARVAEQLSHEKYRYIRAEQLLANEGGVNLFPDQQQPVLPTLGAKPVTQAPAPQQVKPESVETKAQDDNPVDTPSWLWD